MRSTKNKWTYAALLLACLLGACLFFFGSQSENFIGKTQGAWKLELSEKERIYLIFSPGSFSLHAQILGRMRTSACTSAKYNQDARHGGDTILISCITPPKTIGPLAVNSDGQPVLYGMGGPHTFSRASPEEVAALTSLPYSSLDVALETIAKLERVSAGNNVLEGIILFQTSSIMRGTNLDFRPTVSSVIDDIRQIGKRRSKYDPPSYKRGEPLTQEEIAFLVNSLDDENERYWRFRAIPALGDLGAGNALGAFKDPVYKKLQKMTDEEIRPMNLHYITTSLAAIGQDLATASFLAEQASLEKRRNKKNRNLRTITGFNGALGYLARQRDPAVRDFVLVTLKKMEEDPSYPPHERLELKNMRSAIESLPQQRQ